MMRSVRIGNYDTAAKGWTLEELTFPEPEIVSTMVPVPGRIDGPLDLSFALTDGEPMYHPRPLTILLTRSDARPARLAAIKELIHTAHGWKNRIDLPDTPGFYTEAVLSVQTLVNDLYQAKVQITGMCSPWLLSDKMTVVQLTPPASGKITTTITNSGYMPVIPQITVQGPGNSLTLEYNGKSYAMNPGVYTWSDLLLSHGPHNLSYSGDCTGQLRYTEGVIA